MHFLRSQLRLCYIVDDSVASKGSLVSHCSDLIDAGVTSILFRLNVREALAKDMHDELKEVVKLCQSKSRYCFSVDDMLLSLQLNCHGVLFSKVPSSVERAREVMGPGKFIGSMVKSFADIDTLAETEQFDFVDFFGVGPVLQFGDKHTFPLGVEFSRTLTEHIKQKPVFWMGGIRPEELPRFGSGFADGIGVVRSLANGNTLEEARRLHTLLAKSLGPSVWSVGHPPADPTFRFTKLKPEDLKADSVPPVASNRVG